RVFRLYEISRKPFGTFSTASITEQLALRVRSFQAADMMAEFVEVRVGRGTDIRSNALAAATINVDAQLHQGKSSTGHMKEPNPLCARPVERPDRLGRRL